ncbi:hypothetical protein HMI54_006214 [Coelomomyces lativittatus]|nr:hypothetical protein HMI56_007370 [Coelomomyces lativittatus]KAJ1513084.1 hypothetical protein HMI55_005911 [Coelomomyces lativittatus]KAJ1517292.1 hypothetical protein HMI54_006214 [Coelomomyces lativittatus]
MHHSSLTFALFFCSAFLFSITNAQYVIDPSLKNLMMDAHNILRNAVYIPVNLTWSDSLAQEAYRRTLDQQAICGLTHNGVTRTLGENLAMASGSNITEDITKRLLNLWISEGYKPNDYSHWTQMAWSGTREVGCALKVGPPQCQFVFLTCEYYPPGNVVGRSPWSDSGIPPNFASITNLPALTLTNHPETLFPTLYNPSATASPTILPFTPYTTTSISTTTTTSTSLTSYVTVTFTQGTTSTITTSRMTTMTIPVTTTITRTVTQAVPTMVPWPVQVPSSPPVFKTWPVSINGDKTIRALYILLIEFTRLFPNGIVSSFQRDPVGTGKTVVDIYNALSTSSLSYSISTYMIVVISFVSVWTALRLTR